jgi:type IV pilus assembly protein PilN
VHLFNQLSKEVPEGIYLKSLKQTGTRVALTGYAQSSARIATFMNNLDESPFFENSQQKIDIKSETVGGKRLNAFSIETYITRQAAKPGTGKN